MKQRIEALETIRETKKTWKELNVEPTFGKAYLYSFEAGNELPNFGDVIWDDKVEAIWKSMKEHGITEFTISSTYSNLLETIEKFLELGCKLEGMERINSLYERDYLTGEKKRIAALRLSM